MLYAAVLVRLNDYTGSLSFLIYQDRGNASDLISIERVNRCTDYAVESHAIV